MADCINCGSPTARRDGDTLSCPACGYTWDVQHEQANAAYLAAQGRKPAAPIEPDTKPNFDGMKKSELIAYANLNGIAVDDSMLKDDILTVVKASHG